MQEMNDPDRFQYGESRLVGGIFGRANLGGDQEEPDESGFNFNHNSPLRQTKS